jgi:F-type H+-transporting ATPase subunit b
MRIDWWTLALQATNFLILVWLLQHFLYRPVQNIIADRQHRTESVIAEASAAKAAAEQLQGELEQQRAAIAREREQAMEQAHAAAKAEAAALLERARGEAQGLLVEERQRLDQERADAAEALRRDAIDLGVSIARRLLASAADGSLEAPFLTRAAAKLAALPESERRELVDQLAGGEILRVVTATPLEPATSGEFCDKVRDLLGADAQMRFDADPALLAGVELHFPNAILRHSWRDSLRDIEEQLKHDGPATGTA